MTTAKTGCLSSPLVMNPRLGAKERSKSTGWSSSTVICVRGAGQGCFFRYKTGSISVTGSLSAARTRVYDTNPPLVGLVGLVFSDYRRYAWFSCRSTQDRKRSRGSYRSYLQSCLHPKSRQLRKRKSKKSRRKFHSRLLIGERNQKAGVNFILGF